MDIPTELFHDATYDVVVVGSGAGGMVAAIRAHDLGLRAILIEKSDRYGGTSAVSGAGLWIPNNAFIRGVDSDEKALTYLRATTEGLGPEDKLQAYVKMGPELLKFLAERGVEYYVNSNLPYPDYHPDAPGALHSGRPMFVRMIDGATLGTEFFNIRESYPEFKFLGRITVDHDEGGALIHRMPGWRRAVFRHLARYWLDLPWRFKTHRDRRLAHGNALIGGLRKAMLDRKIPLVLNTRLLELVKVGRRVTGIVADCNGQRITINASRGVILATGGYEQSQELRTKYLPPKSQTSWSITPRGNNTGDALVAALDIGAAVEFMDQCWWAPSIPMPSKTSPNTTRSQGIFYERGFPHSLCVNRLGKRFVNEACSYHLFGAAMIADDAATGANMPCWFIFDSRYREKYPLGELMPGWAVPDGKLPSNWFDTFLFRADSLAQLAGKIGLPADTLAQTIGRFNGFARTGVDADFSRGKSAYDQFLGDRKHGPNTCLGEIAQGPFYAVRFNLGDLGSKGGPKTDVNAQVYSTDGSLIDGLYAVGNCAGTLMGNAYPGAGVTLGSTMIFGHLAASHIAQQQAPQQQTPAQQTQKAERPKLVEVESASVR